MRIMRAMRPIEHIRKSVFKMTQAAFADAVGVTQATVSRWDNGMEPGRDDLEQIRKVARERDLEWDDRLFFEVPEGADHQLRQAS